MIFLGQGPRASNNHKKRHEAAPYDELQDAAALGQVKRWHHGHWLGGWHHAGLRDDENVTWQQLVETDSFCGLQPMGQPMVSGNMSRTSQPRWCSLEDQFTLDSNVVGFGVNNWSFTIIFPDCEKWNHVQKLKPCSLPMSCFFFFNPSISTVSLGNPRASPVWSPWASSACGTWCCRMAKRPSKEATRFWRCRCPQRPGYGRWWCGQKHPEVGRWWKLFMTRKLSAQKVAICFSDGLLPKDGVYHITLLKANESWKEKMTILLFACQCQ